MFSQIKTSTKNREIVSELTQGTENIIARIAIAYSLQTKEKFSPIDTQDSGGKEYSRNVLFGNNYQIYKAMMCTYYNISDTDRDLYRYFKIHLDHGLQLIYDDIKNNPNLIGYDYLFDKIELGLNNIK